MLKAGRALLPALVFSLLLATTTAQTEPRARDLGVPFDGTPGPFNAITDVKGVEVGHTTLISGSGPLKVGVGPVRTGVTAVLPRGKNSLDAVFAGWFTLNGNGEMTGTTWLEDSGFLEGPVMITNTHSVGVVRDAVVAWRVKRAPPDDQGYSWSLPVVAETSDDDLNDMNGFHVKAEDAFHALDTARGGPVEEGSVGGGTGMICNEFKGGIGTSSRVLDPKYGGYTVGVLVQCNYGLRSQLRIAGVPIGREIGNHTVREDELGSIIVVVATDAPLIPTQLKRVARRVSLGLQLRLRRLGRYFYRVLNRESGRRRIERRPPAHHASQPAPEPDLSGHGSGHGRSNRQRHGRGQDDERYQRL
jgi:D-aminopeptidase